MSRNYIMENLRAYYPKKSLEFLDRLTTPIYEGRYKELFKYICEENKKNYNNPQESLAKKFQDNLNEFINKLEIDDNEKKYLKTVTPHNYTGIYKL